MVRYGMAVRAESVLRRLIPTPCLSTVAPRKIVASGRTEVPLRCRYAIFVNFMRKNLKKVSTSRAQAAETRTRAFLGATAKASGKKRAFKPTPGLEAGRGPNPKRVRIILQKLQEAYPDRKSTRLNSSHFQVSRMPSSA